MIKSVDFDLIILGSTERGYGLKQSIHIWVTSADYINANLMILLGYILLGHKEWAQGYIKIFAVFPEENMEEERNRLYQLVETGKLPITPKNIETIPLTDGIEVKSVIRKKSRDADLTIIGIRDEVIKHHGKEIFDGYDNIGNTLFVNAAEQKEIK